MAVVFYCQQCSISVNSQPSLSIIDQPFYKAQANFDSHPLLFPAMQPLSASGISQCSPLVVSHSGPAKDHWAHHRATGMEPARETGAPDAEKDCLSISVDVGVFYLAIIHVLEESV